MFKPTNLWATGATTKYINGVKAYEWKPFRKKLWQRNYWEHIIRNEAEYARIAKYIRDNPISLGKKYH
jgi:REP element-mobilizing transposase RayT